MIVTVVKYRNKLYNVAIYVDIISIIYNKSLLLITYLLINF